MDDMVKEILAWFLKLKLIIQINRGFSFLLILKLEDSFSINRIHASWDIDINKQILRIAFQLKIKQNWKKN